MPTDPRDPREPLPRFAALPGDPPALRRELAKLRAEHDPPDNDPPPEPPEEP